MIDFSASLTDGLKRTAGAVLAVAAIAIVTVVAEWRSATPAWRRVLQPAVLVLGAMAAFALGTVLSATLGSDHDLAVVALWIPSLPWAAFPMALLVAQSRARLFAAGALRDMVGWLTPGTTRHDLEATMATVLGDPSLRLAFWVPDSGYVDVAGEPVDVSERTAALTEIHDGGAPSRPSCMTLYSSGPSPASSRMPARRCCWLSRTRVWRPKCATRSAIFAPRARISRRA